MTMLATQERPVFSGDFLDQFDKLLAWRRDVRHFRTDPVPDDLLDQLLDLVQLAPSVGNSQPWRFVDVRDARRRGTIRANFQSANASALAGYAGERAKLYASLKLAGLDRAPAQWAVFCDEMTSQGLGLGRTTMPESLAYSVVAAVQTLWLAARARGLGVGWVSIINPEAVRDVLDVPASWRLIAYLCLGWPEVDTDVPDLVRSGWQDRTSAGRLILRR